MIGKIIITGPPADDWRLNLNPPDEVVYQNDDDAEITTTVKYAPWQLAHGEWVIGLKGIAGGYLLSRVVRKGGAA